MGVAKNTRNKRPNYKGTRAINKSNIRLKEIVEFK